MYAVIKTGGKQYRVQPGDLLVVEKLDGAPGDAVAFDQVLMLGGDAGVTLGAPIVAGAVVNATLIETRKGEKVKVFKKIRRQGYKRTKGHRQQESVLRVTGLTVGGKSEKWDGTVDLTPRSELNLRARNLASRIEYVPVEAAPAKAKAPKAAAPKAEAHVETLVEAPEAKAPKVKATVVETNAPDVASVEAAPKTEAKAKAAPKAAAKPKAETATEDSAAPKAKKPAAPKAPKA
jgi:large subunit ribosomal protein L21